MNAQQTHLDTGARALHALSPAAAAEFDAHLPGCDTCAEELRGFRETLASVGAALARPPAAGLRARVMLAVDVTPQLPPRIDEPLAVHAEIAGPADARHPWYRRRAGLLAAAAAVLIAAGAVALAVSGTRGPGSQSADMMQCVQQAPDAHVLVPDVGTAGAVTMAPSCNAAVVQPAGLPAAPTGMVYQLWVMAGPHARSMGMMHENGTGGMPMMVTGTRSGDTAIGITVEPAGGSAQPTSAPVWLVPLPA